MTTVDVIALFRQAVLEVHGRTLDGLDSATVISTLGLNSIDVMEMTGFIEDTLKIQIPDEDLAEVETLGQLEKLIHGLLADKATP